MKYRFLVFERFTRLKDGKLDKVSTGKFVFKQDVDYNEEYPPGKRRNSIYALYAFPDEAEEFPEFSASQLVDACLWADNFAKRLDQYGKVAVFLRGNPEFDFEKYGNPTPHGTGCKF
jgi:hypothetical protein